MPHGMPHPCRNAAASMPQGCRNAPHVAATGTTGHPLETSHAVIIWWAVHGVCFVTKGLGTSPMVSGLNEPF